MERILRDFYELVQTDAVSKDERAVADIVIGKLKEIGCTVSEDNVGEKIGGNTGNVHAVLEGTAPGSILFSSHMDRVINGKGIKPKVEGENIVSDGATILAADDIAGIVAILEGMRLLKESGQPYPTIEVLYTVCEEAGLAGSRYMDPGIIQSKLGFVLDCPGRVGRIMHSAPAYAALSYEVKGKNAHAGNKPEEGLNAVYVAAKLLTSLKDGRIDPLSTANFSVFEADGPLNIVNDYARVAGEARSRDPESLNRYIEEFKATCESVAAETGATITYDVDLAFEAFHIPEDSANIRIMKRVFDTMGKEMRIEGGGGGMDGNRYNAWGIPSIGVAVGYFKNHSVDEYIVLEDLLCSGELMRQIVLSYMQEMN